MIGRKKRAADFPEGGVEVTDINDVAARIADLDAVANTIRRAHENINPADEAGYGCLQRETKYQGNKTQRDDGSVPIDEKNGHDDEADGQDDCQPQNPLQIEARNDVAHARED